MAALPIAARESRIVCRRTRTYVMRSVIAGLGVVGIVVALWIARYDPLEQGNAVFLGIGLVAQIYALFAGVIVAADAIAAERREQTLGLLFLTDLRPHQVLVGKWIAASTTAIFGLLAIIPLLAVPLLMGGVSLERFSMLALTLLNTLFLSISLGFLFSSIFQAGWLALTFGIGWMLLTGVIVPLLAEWHDWSEGAYFFMPSAGYLAIFDSGSVHYMIYWQAGVFNHLFAWCAMALAAARLVYVWKDRPRTWRQQRQFERFRVLRYGARRARQKLRAKLLDQNPLSWLVNREQVSSSGLLSIFTILFACAGLSMLFSSNPLEDVSVVGAAALWIAHGALVFRICLAAAYALAEDRRSGALELLLSTPIKVREIIRGRWLGLFRQFLGAIIVVMVFHALVLTATAWERRIHGNSVDDPDLLWEGLRFCLPATLTALLPLIWIAAGWVGMWFGLRFKKSATALWATITTVVVAPALLIASAFGGMQIFGVQSALPRSFTAVNVCYAVFIFDALFNGVLMQIARWKLERHFRAAAADRFLDFSFPFPWKAIVRYSIGAACIAALLLAGAFGWRAYSVHQGEAAWTAVVTAHPDFPMEPPFGAYFPATIPADKNLAQCPLLKPLDTVSKDVRPEFRRRIINEGLPPVYKLRYPFMQNYGGGGAWVQAPQIIRFWASGDFLPLEVYETFLRKRNMITNRAASASRSILEFYKKDLDKLIDELEIEAKKRPQTQFSQMPTFLPQINMTISIRAIARLRLGEPAVDDILLMLRLAEGTTRLGQPLHAAISPVFQPLFEGLAQRRWTDADLQQIQEALARLDLWAPEIAHLQQLTRGNLKMVDDRTQHIEQGDLYFMRMKYFWTGRALSLRVKARLLELGAGDFAQIVDASKRRVDLRRAFQVSEETIASDLLDYELTPPMIQDVMLFAYAQTSLNQAQIACALERYRLVHHRFPNILEALAPEYIPAVPNDMMTGRPMIYRPTDDRDKYELYSVGWDGIDNNARVGGQPTGFAPSTEQHGIDWVWNPLRQAE